MLEKHGLQVAKVSFKKVPVPLTTWLFKVCVEAFNLNPKVVFEPITNLPLFIIFPPTLIPPVNALAAPIVLKSQPVFMVKLFPISNELTLEVATVTCLLVPNPLMITLFKVKRPEVVEVVVLTPKPKLATVVPTVATAPDIIVLKPSPNCKVWLVQLVLILEL